jgi:hypothetical protein
MVESDELGLQTAERNITIAIQARFDNFDKCAGVGLLGGVSNS